MDGPHRKNSFLRGLRSAGIGLFAGVVIGILSATGCAPAREIFEPEEVFVVPKKVQTLYETDFDNLSDTDWYHLVKSTDEDAMQFEDMLSDDTPTVPSGPCLDPYEEDIGVREKVDRVACLYDVDEWLLKGLWQLESGINHYKADGTVKGSFDGKTMGIAQVFPTASGTSIVDGHSLNPRNEVENMELGAIVLKGKLNSGLAIAQAVGFETRPPSAEEPYGAVHYVCTGEMGAAYNHYGSSPDSVRDVWYSTPEDLMAKGYNGWKCGKNWIASHGTEQGKRISCVIMYYVDIIQNNAGASNPLPAACGH